MTENNDFNNTENEKRYKVNIDHHKTSRNYVTGILDCETNVLLDNHTAINNRLNEQHETIQSLKIENDELKREVNLLTEFFRKNNFSLDDFNGWLTKERWGWEAKEAWSERFGDLE